MAGAGVGAARSPPSGSPGVRAQPPPCARGCPSRASSALGPVGSFLQEPQAEGGPLPACPFRTLAGCTVLGVVCRPQFCPRCYRVCGVLPETPGRVSDPPLLLPRWSAEWGEWIECSPQPQPYISQTPQAQAPLFFVRVGSCCGCPAATESWSQTNKSRVVGQVLGRGPLGPGLGDAVMSAAAPPFCRVM